ncbi:hypothetical protein BGLA2_280035 [Burkholderia gladioli]|nr:hypothetical protein BGLA2_280035 [Burkholderia gladioli]
MRRRRAGSVVQRVRPRDGAESGRDLAARRRDPCRRRRRAPYRRGLCVGHVRATGCRVLPEQHAALRIDCLVARGGQRRVSRWSSAVARLPRLRAARRIRDIRMGERVGVGRDDRGDPVVRLSLGVFVSAVARVLHAEPPVRVVCPAVDLVCIRVDLRAVDRDPALVRCAERRQLRGCVSIRLLSGVADRAERRRRVPARRDRSHGARGRADSGSARVLDLCSRAHGTRRGVHGRRTVAVRAAGRPVLRRRVARRCRILLQPDAAVHDAADLRAAIPGLPRDPGAAHRFPVPTELRRVSRRRAVHRVDIEPVGPGEHTDLFPDRRSADGGRDRADVPGPRYEPSPVTGAGVTLLMRRTNSS